MAARYYSQKEIQDSLVRVGAKVSTAVGQPGLAEILAAVAMAETGAFEKPGYANFDRVGDLDRVGQPTGYGQHYDASYSCYQIRCIKELEGTYLLRDKLRVLESLDNASAIAVEISKSSGLQAWTTYTSEKYKAFLPLHYPPPPGKYQVVTGDTFLRIDEKLKLERGTMQRLNPTIDPLKLRAGMLLEIPYQELTVVPGDSLTRLMRIAGWSTYTDADITRVAEFAGLVDRNKIFPGQKLRILKPSM